MILFGSIMKLCVFGMIHVILYNLQISLYFCDKLNPPFWRNINRKLKIAVPHHTDSHRSKYVIYMSSKGDSEEYFLSCIYVESISQWK